MTWNTFTQSYLVSSEAIQLTMHYAAVEQFYEDNKYIFGISI